ncbi:MAG: monovalent cation/H(+) antiporter subunit G [Coriobacteriia bacterium]|nr:monovalent cation/H(+) antiporter subunit G [Coriobacteriia bacterium]
MTSLDPIRTAVAVVLVSVGGLFFLIGTIGLLRLPDFFTRTHAATKCDTVGAGSLLIGLAVYDGASTSALKILVLVLLVLVSSPTSGHALARAAYRTGLKPWRAGEEREVS